MDLKDRIRALRKHLDLTQDELAQRSGLERVEIVNLEGGRNQASTIRILRGLAKGLGLQLQDTADLIDGDLTVEEAISRTESGVREVLSPELARAAGIHAQALRQLLVYVRDPAEAERSLLWLAGRTRDFAVAGETLVPAARRYLEAIAARDPFSHRYGIGLAKAVMDTWEPATAGEIVVPEPTTTFAEVAGIRRGSRKAER